MFAPSIFFSHGSPMASITISPFQKDFHTVSGVRGVSTRVSWCFKGKSVRRPATRPKRQTGSPGLFNERISLGKRILSQEWHTIQSTFRTAMFRLLSDGTSFFTSRFQKRQLGVGTSELPQSHCGGSTNTFPKYGRLKASQRAWKMATNGTSTARRGTISE
jgi:hypothetical protein